jgi:hypothetical protein
LASFACRTEKAQELATGHRRHGFRRPLDRAPQRLARIELAGEEVVDRVVGRVLDHPDLFQYDLPFALQLLGVEQWALHDVGQQVDGLLDVLVQHLRVETGVFLGGEGVDLPSDGVHAQRDLAGCSVPGAFEDQMFDEVRDPVQPRGLVAASAAQPHADRDRPHLRHGLGEQGQPVVQHFLANHDGS